MSSRFPSPIKSSRKNTFNSEVTSNVRKKGAVMSNLFQKVKNILEEGANRSKVLQF